MEWRRDVLLLRALSERGFHTTFYEPDAHQRQEHRDIPDPPWAAVRVYAPTQQGVDEALEEARGADLVVKASGVGVFDEYLEASVLTLRGPKTLVTFWDVDAPATLTRVKEDPSDPFGVLVRDYDIVFTYGGGPPVVNAYLALGARACVPIYNALDPSTHYPVPRRKDFQATLGFLGNRLPDREARVLEFFAKPAQLLPRESFLLGGNGWQAELLPANIRRLGHVYTRDHNAFNSSPRAVLEQARFAASVLGVDIEFRVLSVYDIASLRERFDIVLFMGVLYHLRHPLYALDHIAEHVVGDLMVFQSMLRGSTQVAEVQEDYDSHQTEQFEVEGFPRMLFIEHSYTGDPTTWWIPNRAGLEAMLRSADFSMDADTEVYVCRRTRRARDGPRAACDVDRSSMPRGALSAGSIS